MELTDQEALPGLNTVYRCVPVGYSLDLQPGALEFDPRNESTCAATYGFVTDLDSNLNKVKINDKWYNMEEQPRIYDYTPWYDDENDVEYLDDLDEVSVGDLVWYGIKSPDYPNYLDLLLVVNGMDVYFGWN